MWLQTQLSTKATYGDTDMNSLMGLTLNPSLALPVNDLREKNVPINSTRKCENWNVQWGVKTDGDSG